MVLISTLAHSCFTAYELNDSLFSPPLSFRFSSFEPTSSTSSSDFILSLILVFSTLYHYIPYVIIIHRVCISSHFLGATHIMSLIVSVVVFSLFSFLGAVLFFHFQGAGLM